MSDSCALFLCHLFRRTQLVQYHLKNQGYLFRLNAANKWTVDLAKTGRYRQNTWLSAKPYLR